MIRMKYTKPWNLEETENWISDYLHRGYRLHRVIGPFFQFIRDEKAENKRCYMSVYVHGHDSIPDEWKLKSFYWAKGVSSYVYEIIKDSNKNRSFCSQFLAKRYALIRIRMGFRAFASAFLSAWSGSHILFHNAETEILLVMLPVSLAALCYCTYSIYAMIRLTRAIHRS